MPNGPNDTLDCLDIPGHPNEGQTFTGMCPHCQWYFAIYTRVRRQLEKFAVPCEHTTVVCPRCGYSVPGDSPSSWPTFVFHYNRVFLVWVAAPNGAQARKAISLGHWTGIELHGELNVELLEGVEWT